MMHSAVRLIPLAFLVACSDSGGGGTSAAAIDVVEVPLEAPLGAPRAAAWTVEIQGRSDCYALAAGDTYFYGDSGVTKLSIDPMVGTLWGVAIPGLESCAAQVHPTADGGAVVVAEANAPSRTLVARVSSAGMIVWQKTLADRDPLGGAKVASALLASGELAITHAFAPPAGSPGAPGHFIVLLDTNGDEKWRTEVPAILVSAADSHGIGTGTRTPGVGIPVPTALAAAPDGGIFFTGQYQFASVIECESYDMPVAPRTSGCGSTAVDGLIGRVEASGTLSFAARLGDAYDSGYVFLSHIAALSDGAVLVAGDRQAERYWERPLHVQAVVARYSQSGELDWAKAIPYGKAPGVEFGRGTGFTAVAPRDAGAADLVFRAPNGVACRLLRMEADGSVSHIQILESSPTSLGAPGAACEALTAGSELGYIYAASAMVAKLVKLAR